MQNITIRIPSALRAYTGGASEIQAFGSTVGEAFESLKYERGEFLTRIMTGEGKIQKFVKVYLGGRSISSLDGLNTPLRHGDVLVLVQAMVGG